MKAIYLFFIFTALFISCSGSTEPVEPLIEMDRESFEKEFAAWNLQGIKNYQFSYEYSSSSIGPSLKPVKITIEEGTESIIEHPYDYIESVPYTSIAQLYERLNYLFEDIEKIKKGTYSRRPVKSAILQIEYDTQYHYPQMIRYTVLFMNMEGIGGNPHFIMRVIDLHKN